MTQKVYCLAETMFFRLPVAVAATSSGATYPLVYVNSSAPPVTGSPLLAT